MSFRMGNDMMEECLDPAYSTTRRVYREPSASAGLADERPLAPQAERVVARSIQGGLRTRGYRKRNAGATIGEERIPSIPLISIITVVFNAADHMEQTIQSVLGQSYDNVEYIIVDGGSTDATVDIIRKYEHAIDFWMSEPDGGIYDAMNKGVKLSSGYYVALLNASDWYDEHLLDSIALTHVDSKANEHSILYTNFQLFLGDLKFAEKRRSSHGRA
jgi:hypothetical protein